MWVEKDYTGVIRVSVAIRAIAEMIGKICLAENVC